MEENDFVSIWLEESGNPAIVELGQLNEELAAKAGAQLSERGLSAMDLALAVDINPDEIKRWLDGRQPLSSAVLDEISVALSNFQPS